jgi:UDP-N-acetylmuramoyl-tripeptide--D-alanyl-D-alanine ligase
MNIPLLYQAFLQSRKVSTDTRKIEKGAIFFALKGPNFNANAFVDEALAKGALLVVIDDPIFVREGKTILVDDSLLALQELAKYHRSQLKIPVIGLTGSNGKTTTKELIAAVLSKKFKTFATQGNLNNHIGVPLSILSIDDSIEIAVIEMGANHVGEIALLSSIANPTHGFITNVGKAHIGTFGGFENIVRGKTELYQHLIANHGKVFINGTDPLLSNMKWRFEKPIMYLGQESFLNIQLIEGGTFVKYKNEEGAEIETKITGAYNFANIAAALAIGKFFGVDARQANKAIVDYAPSNMRSQVLKKGSNTIILDAYNANPSSMEAAIRNLVGMKATSKVVIVGDMYELEEESEKEHRAIGQLLTENSFDQVLLCGAMMRWAKEECTKAKHFEKKDLLIDYLKINRFENTTILVKASRGIGLETVLDYL